MDLGKSMSRGKSMSQNPVFFLDLQKEQINQQ